MKQLFSICLMAILLNACSNNSDGNSNIVGLNLIVDKEFAIAGIDSIKLTANAFDEFSYRVEIDPQAIKFHVNGNMLNEQVWYPDARGSYELTATYQGFESNKITVQVADLLEDMEELELNYDGNTYLTTEEWSVSGSFRFLSVLNGKKYPIPVDKVQLLLDDNPVQSNTGFQFEEAGLKSFQGVYNDLKSNQTSISVRERKTYPFVRIPVVFHTYGIQTSSQNLSRLIDTLNAVFNRMSFDPAEVQRKLVNPNAVGLGIQFYLAETAPSGFNLESPGLDVIANPDPDLPVINYSLFKDLEEQHTWNTETYINIWVTEFFTFDLSPEESAGFNFARGLTNLPTLKDVELDGLQTISSQDTSENQFAQGPLRTTHSILLNGGSVFGEHPDYIVSMMGHFLGLHTTNAFGCSNNGDFCDDTLVPDFFLNNSSVAEFESCDGLRFVPTNFMAAGRQYRDLTYDQRERVRFVLEHGIDRPKPE